MSLPRIDIHTHAFHPKIAAKALLQLESYYHISPSGNGLVDNLLLHLQEGAMDYGLVHSAATKASQVVPANDWAIHIQAHYPQLSSFGTIHPDFAHWPAELNRLEAAGIQGIKLHPDFQGFRLDDPRLFPIFEAIGTRFVLMLHVGDRKPPELNPSCPRKVAAIKRRFPELILIAAHFGGFMHWDLVVEHLADSGVYIDTSSALSAISDRQLHDIVGAFPRDRILFGSDYPLGTPAKETLLLKHRLNLSQTELEELFTNANRILDFPASN
jgi:predicted TIM-barrel fold metal-dependent hydrolase